MAPLANSAHNKHRIFPHGFGDAITRGFWELVGFALFAGAVALAVALVSYNPDDPSFNVATDLPTHNLLGSFGAYFADFALQWFGAASALMPLIAAAWAWRLVSSHGLRLWWVNLFFCPVALGLMAAVLSSFKVPAGWPLPAGFGGVAGDVLIRRAAVAVGSPPGEVGGIAFLLFLIDLLVLVPCMGLTLGQWHALGSRAKATGSLAGRIGLRLGAGLMAAVNWINTVKIANTGSQGPSNAEPARSQARGTWQGGTVVAEPPVVEPKGERPKGERPGHGNPKQAEASMADMAARGVPVSAPVLSKAKAWVLKLVEDQRGQSAVDSAAGREFTDERPDVPLLDLHRLDSVAEPSAVNKQVGTPSRTPPELSQQAVAEALPPLDPDAADSYHLPPLDLLQPPQRVQSSEMVSEETLEANARVLEGVLEDFGVRGQIVKVHPGPVVTLYELEPAPGTKSARVIGLADDIARSMSAISARVSVIPGRNAIGIELPNTKREMVYLSELLNSSEYETTSASLPLALGKDIGGGAVLADLARMPHLLVAGTTGSGKSVAINTMILSLLYHLPPEACKLIMIDPKMLELSVYEGIPHLLAPVVTEPGKAVVALKWAVREMEDRYRKMSRVGVRNIAGYNQRVAEAREKGEELRRTVQTGFDPATGKPVYEDQALPLDPLPFIVIIVDEFADLMIVAGKDIEGAIQRLAQMARAAGLHIVLATQRPSVDVITGTIKANFPTRISFQVTSKIDSRTILGEQGAEQLLGQGDMLYMAGGGRVTRVHGPFCSDDEVEKIVAFLKTQGSPTYLEEVTEEPEGIDAMGAGMAGGGNTGDDLYDRAVALVAREGKASTSFIQRHLQIGYNRAARIIEQMEEAGIVGKPNHVGKREVLINEAGERVL